MRRHDVKRPVKVSSKKNREEWDKIAEGIFSLIKKQIFHYDLGFPLKNVKKDYSELSDFLIKAQKRRNGKIRQKIKKATESLVLNAINFHLNFFHPSLLGLHEEKALKTFQKEMRTIFIRKNADYGDAFRFWGIPGVVVRIGDKYFRLLRLSQRGYKRKIEDEKIPDTALDLANYGIMLLMLLEEGYSLRWGE